MLGEAIRKQVTVSSFPSFRVLRSPSDTGAVGQRQCWGGVTAVAGHRMWRMVSSVITTAVVLCGCSTAGPEFQVGDPESELVARIVSAAYSGSMNAVRESLEPRLQKLMPDYVMGAVADALRDEFGRPLRVRRQSAKPGAPAGSGESVWRVDGQRATFEIKLARGADGIVTGIWFRRSGGHEWLTAVGIAKGYVARLGQRVPARGP